MSERFRDLLPWYVNGTLDDGDREWVENYLREHPSSRAELSWHESLRERIREGAPQVPATIGLDRALQRIAGQRPTFADRLRAWFGGRDGLRPAYGIALVALVLVQAGVIANLWQQHTDDQQTIRAGRTEPVDDAPLLKVNFAAGTKEADLRFLLLEVQGVLVGGPGQLGDYYVRVPKGRESDAVAQLRGLTGVQSVELVAALPARR